MERVGIKLPVEQPREEDACTSLLWLHLKVDAAEDGLATLVYVVQVHKDRGDALPAVGAEGTPRGGMRVDAVVVLHVPERYSDAR